MAERLLRLILSANASDAVHGFGEVNKAAAKTASESTKHSGTIAKSFKVAAAAATSVVGAAIAVGAAGIEMADKFELAQNKLVAALKTTGTSFAAQKVAVDKLVKSGADLGFNQIAVTDTLANMTIGLGDVHKAMGAFQVVEDLAAAKGIDLQTAGLAVTKAMEGQLRPLKQLGIDLPIAAGGALKVEQAQTKLDKANTKLLTTQGAINAGLLKGPAALKALAKAQADQAAAQANFNDKSQAGGNILDALGQKLKGQAAAGVAGFAGEQKKLKAHLDNLLTTLGQDLIPILVKFVDFIVNKVIPAIQDFANWLQKHKEVAIALGVVLGALVIAALAIAHPFILAAAAIAGIVVGITYAYNNFKTFRVVVRDTVEWISKNFPKFVEGLKAEFHAIATGVSAFVGFFQAIWKRWGDSITNIVKGAWTFIGGYIKSSLELVRGVIKIITALIHGDWSGVWDGMKLVFAGFWDYVSGTAKAAGQVLVGVFQGIWEGIKSFWNATIGNIHVSIPDWVPVVGGDSFDGPRLAMGGIVSRPTVAMIGERGPEAVVPLGRGGGLGGVTINIAVSGSNARDLVNDIALEIQNGGGRNLQRALGVA